MGFEIERLEIAIHPYLICLFCRLVVEEPTLVDVPGCGHVFCKSCLHRFCTANTPPLICREDEVEFSLESIKSPDEYFTEQYSQLRIKCMFYDKCPIVMPIGEIALHQKICKHKTDQKGTFFIVYSVYLFYLM